MPLTITCPDPCQRQFQVKDDLAGKRVKCPACGKVLAVPAAAPPEPHPENAPKKKKKRRGTGEGRPAQVLFSLMGVEFTPALTAVMASLLLGLGVGLYLLFTRTPLASLVSSAPEATVVDVYTAVNGLGHTGVAERVLQSGTVAYTIPGHRKLVVTRPSPEGGFLLLKVRIPHTVTDEAFAGSRGPVILSQANLQLKGGAGEAVLPWYVTDRNDSPTGGYHFGYAPPRQEGRTATLRDYLGPGKAEAPLHAWTHPGALKESAEALVFEGQRGMRVTTALGARRLDGEENSNPLDDLTGAKTAKGLDRSGLVAAPEGYVRVTWDAGSTGWLVAREVERPNDVSLSWEVTCLFPKPPGADKGLTLLIFNKPTPIRLP